MAHSGLRTLNTCPLAGTEELDKASLVCKDVDVIIAFARKCCEKKVAEMADYFNCIFNVPVVVPGGIEPFLEIKRNVIVVESRDILSMLPIEYFFALTIKKCKKLKLWNASALIIADDVDIKSCLKIAEARGKQTLSVEKELYKIACWPNRIRCESRDIERRIRKAARLIEQLRMPLGIGKYALQLFANILYIVRYKKHADK
jgi:hypothetical protein